MSVENFQRPKGWTTISTPDGKIRYWVEARDPLDLDTVEAIYTTERSCVSALGIIKAMDRNFDPTTNYQLPTMIRPEIE